MQEDMGRTIGAVVLIGVGVVFLLGQFINLSFLFTLWPFLIILPGVAFLAAALYGDEKDAGLIMPGLIITGTGVLLLFQSVTNLWYTWSYAWAIYPALAGLGMMFMGARTGNDKLAKEGRQALNAGLVMFVIFAAFFELFIFGSLGWGVTSLVVPVLLILAGGWMLLQGRGTAGRKSKNDDWDV